MEFRINQKVFARALATVSKAADRKATMPILSHVLIRASGDSVILACYDLDTAIQIRIPAEVPHTGEVAIDARNAAHLIKACPAGELTIATDDKGNATINGAGGFSSLLLTMPPADFPNLPPMIPDNARDIDAGELTRVLRAIEPSISKDQRRQNMTVAEVRSAGLDLVATATDGHRAARKSMRADVGAWIAYLSRPAIRAICREFKKGTIQIAHWDDGITVRSGDLSMHVRSRKTDFPPVDQVLGAADDAIKIVVDAGDLAAACARAAGSLKFFDVGKVPHMWILAHGGSVRIAAGAEPWQGWQREITGPGHAPFWKDIGLLEYQTTPPSERRRAPLAGGIFSEDIGATIEGSAPVVAAIAPDKVLGVLGKKPHGEVEIAISPDVRSPVSVAYLGRSAAIMQVATGIEGLNAWPIGIGPRADREHIATHTEGPTMKPKDPPPPPPRKAATKPKKQRAPKDPPGPPPCETCKGSEKIPELGPETGKKIGSRPCPDCQGPPELIDCGSCGEVYDPNDAAELVAHLHEIETPPAKPAAPPPRLTSTDGPGEIKPVTNSERGTILDQLEAEIAKIPGLAPKDRRRRISRARRILQAGTIGYCGACNASHSGATCWICGRIPDDVEAELAQWRDSPKRWREIVSWAGLDLIRADGPPNCCAESRREESDEEIAADSAPGDEDFSFGDDDELPPAAPTAPSAKDRADALGIRIVK